MANKNDFATARMLPLLMRMAAPAVAAQTVNMLYGLVDRVFIGHIAGVGATALAGVGVCNTINYHHLCICAVRWGWRGAADGH